MSRGFVKEDDQEEAPLIPPRAALPAGVSNYVTPNGLQELLREREELEKLRLSLPREDETERRRSLAVIDGKMNLLYERISTARVLEPKEQPKKEVRFGATVTIKYLDRNQEQVFQIVGVDEADVKEQKIAFTAPIARAVTGKKLNEQVVFSLGDRSMELKITGITYKD